MEIYMVRRQRKTREAIFGAFIALLAKKSFDHITVGEIIDGADVGRATFYAHFETKDELFLRYFKDGLRELIQREQAQLGLRKPEQLPDDFWVNHVTATFVETVRWWVSHGMKQTPQTVAQYFLAVV